MKICKYTFCMELIEDIYWNYYVDDVITVMSLVLKMQSVSAVFCTAVFCNSQVEQHCELNKKSEQVQQANVFKRQSIVFHFSTYLSKFISYPIMASLTT